MWAPSNERRGIPNLYLLLKQGDILSFVPHLILRQVHYTRGGTNEYVHTVFWYVNLGIVRIGVILGLWPVPFLCLSLRKEKAALQDEKNKQRPPSNRTSLPEQIRPIYLGGPNKSSQKYLSFSGIETQSLQSNKTTSQRTGIGNGLCLKSG